MSETLIRERGEILADLEHEGPKWVDLRNRCERTANLDRELMNRRDWTMQHIDYLLEELLQNNVILSLEASHEMAV